MQLPGRCRGGCRHLELWHSRWHVYCVTKRSSCKKGEKTQNKALDQNYPCKQKTFWRLVGDRKTPAEPLDHNPFPTDAQFHLRAKTIEKKKGKGTQYPPSKQPQQQQLKINNKKNNNKKKQNTVFHLNSHFRIKRSLCKQKKTRTEPLDHNTPFMDT